MDKLGNDFYCEFILPNVTFRLVCIEMCSFSYNSCNYKLHYDFCSQPPLLSSMIYEIYNSTGDIELVKRSLPALRKEYEFWNSGITAQLLDLIVHYLWLDYSLWYKILFTFCPKFMVFDFFSFLFILQTYIGWPLWMLKVALTP